MTQRYSRGERRIGRAERRQERRAGRRSDARRGGKVARCDVRYGAPVVRRRSKSRYSAVNAKSTTGALRGGPARSNVVFTRLAGRSASTIRALP